METRDYRFFQNSELDMNIICEVLDKWCVPYKVKANRIDNFPFKSQTEYDIIVNTTDESWLWIKNKVKERFDNLNDLEECYDLNTVTHPLDKVEEEPEHDIMEDLFNHMKNPKPSPRRLSYGERDDICLDTILKTMLGQENRQLVKLKDVPQDIRERILQDTSIDDICSGRCKIYKVDSGYVVEVHKED